MSINYKNNLLSLNLYFHNLKLHIRKTYYKYLLYHNDIKVK